MQIARAAVIVKTVQAVMMAWLARAHAPVLLDSMALTVRRPVTVRTAEVVMMV